MNIITSRTLLKGGNSTAQATWWTKIYTTNPFCIYHFGPFDRISEAEMSRFGYIQDLEDEGSKVVFMTLTQCCPEDLTLEFKNLSHVKWLHELMQDSLMIKLPSLPEINSSKQAAYV
jgi:Domain of unknown function (DUF1816)